MLMDYEKAKCPKCGSVLEDVDMLTNPPIHVVRCHTCGFEKRAEPHKKPPLGCTPYYVSSSARIGELCEAIKRCSTESGKHNQIKLWTAEIQCLNEMDRVLRRIEKEKTWVEEKNGMLKEVE